MCIRKKGKETAKKQAVESGKSKTTRDKTQNLNFKKYWLILWWKR
jgi:hypothetical protein